MLGSRRIDIDLAVDGALDKYEASGTVEAQAA
jgi:hypothetical protein